MLKRDCPWYRSKNKNVTSAIGSHFPMPEVTVIERFHYKYIYIYIVSCSPSKEHSFAQFISPLIETFSKMNARRDYFVEKTHLGCQRLNKTQYC